MTFWPKSHPETWEKHADMSTRTPAISGTKGLKHGGLNIQGGASACFGGHGLSASMPAFFQILTSLLQDDGRLLKPETTKMMFEPQLNEREREGMRNVFRSKEQSGMFVGDFEGVEGLDWGIGGVLMGEGGTLCWSGMPNLFWVRLPPSPFLSLTPLLSPFSLPLQTQLFLKIPNIHPRSSSTAAHPSVAYSARKSYRPEIARWGN